MIWLAFPAGFIVGASLALLLAWSLLPDLIMRVLALILTPPGARLRR